MFSRLEGFESAMGLSSFRYAEEKSQADYFTREFPGMCGVGGQVYRLQDEHRFNNIAPEIRDVAEAYFTKYGIAWHQHSNHALSSQVACLNFLMPLARRPDLLAQLVQHAVGGDLPEMLAVEEGPDAEPWFVGFEWIGKADYLNEWPKSGRPTRGANVTSADAIVRFRQEGRSETLLIEWKYTEKYGAPTVPDGNLVRTGRYERIAFDPAGPIRSDLELALEDFYWEPFYQLLRQQMLAHRMEAEREDGTERVRVLHIAPSGNTGLTKVTSPRLRRFGDNAFRVFSSLLAQPDRFISRSTESLFAPLVAELAPTVEWARYLSDRYASLLASDGREAM